MSDKRGVAYYKESIKTLNPTPTIFSDYGFEEHTLNPTPIDFNPDEHDDLTRNPTPQNFNVDFSPTHETTLDPTYTPTYLPTRRPTNEPSSFSPTFEPTKIPTRRPTNEPTYIPTYEPTYEPSLAPVKHSDNSLVSDIQTVIPSWNLNEGASWTVVIFFFLIMTCVCSLMVYNMFIKSPNEKRRKRGQNSIDDDIIISDGTSNPMSESDPLLQTNKPSKTMTRVSTVHSEALKEFLVNGKIIDLHTSKGKKTVEISLSGTDVKWKTINDIFPKKFKLDLKTVYEVEMGKKTQNFRKSVCPDDNCLSLVSEKSTLDIETKSTIDRDIMYQGFFEMVENMKEKV